MEILTNAINFITEHHQLFTLLVILLVVSYVLYEIKKMTTGGATFARLIFNLETIVVVALVVMSLHCFFDGAVNGKPNTNKQELYVLLGTLVFMTLASLSIYLLHEKIMKD